MRMLIVILLLLLGGCSAGVHSSLVEMEMKLAFPFWEEQTMPVVFPDRQSGGAAAAETGLAQEYGPAWRNVTGDYPEYRFNP